MQAFKDYSLNKNILKAIDELGFTSPTPIQEKVIPAILNGGKDIIGLAQTGTGKTAGFGLPVIEQLTIPGMQTQALILCPTRELCMQIHADLKRYSSYSPGINILAVYGGTSIIPQIKELREGSHIVVGTPGRTLDLIKRKALALASLRWVVLDEADEMLNMGFKEELDAILAHTPVNRQTLLFSATMPGGVRQIADNYMNNPVEISAGKKNTVAENIEHHYYVVKAADRYLALKRIADMHPDIYGIVFCRTRRETKEVADKLIQDSYNADALHGDLSQAQRDHVMQRFRNRHLQLLVATDVAARGLDMHDLSHVINYNLPDDPDVYIHRSGRTGRAGKHGISISITHSRERRRIEELENLCGKRFKYREIPGGKEICEKRLFNLIDRVEKVEVDESKIASFLPVINKKLAWLDREDLIKHFVSVEFNRFLEYYKNAPDLNVRPAFETEKKKKQKEKVRYTRFYINLGSKAGMNAARLIALINETMGRKDARIGKIDIQRNFSFFEADKQFEKAICSSFENLLYHETPVNVNVSTGKVNDKPYKARSHKKNKGKKRK